MAVKEAQKSQVAHAGNSTCPGGTVSWWTVNRFYHSSCINSNGWWEGNLSRLYHVCDIIKPYLKPTLEAVTGPEWCKCLELLQKFKFLSVAGFVSILNWGSEGQRVSVDLAAWNITCWSQDQLKTFFFPPQGNTSFYLYHTLERFITNVCAVSHCLALQKTMPRAGRENYLW